MITYDAPIITALDKFKALFDAEFASPQGISRFNWWYNSDDPTQPQIEIHPKGSIALELMVQSRPSTYQLGGMFRRDYEVFCYLYKPLTAQPQQGMTKGEISHKEALQFWSDFEAFIEKKANKQVSGFWELIELGQADSVPGLYKQKPMIIFATSIIFTILTVRG